MSAMFVPSLVHTRKNRLVRVGHLVFRVTSIATRACYTSAGMDYCRPWTEVVRGAAGLPKLLDLYWGAQKRTVHKALVEARLVGI